METGVGPPLGGRGGDGVRLEGVVGAGLRVAAEGPRVIGENGRFGDPECRPVMMRLKSDFLEVLLAAVNGKLDKVELEWHRNAALTVVMAAEGYPGSYEKGSEIKGLGDAEANGAVVFHAGTTLDGERILASGGRVLGVTAMAPGVTKAQKKAYEAVAKIDWPEGFNRTDIGWRAVKR